jgi:4-amino-4-deoxy-L-arabinose transferase-like glycosyltransferase
MLRNLGRTSILLPIAIVLLAAFLRLYRLDALPPGLHYDEAFNATMAQRVLAGIERPIFFREDLTEEPMAIYVTALSFALFGASPWSLRLVSALAGIMNVAALYFLARVLLQSRFAAALAAFVLAILYWHINFSRLGMEPIFAPLTMTLAFAFLWQGISSVKWQVSREGTSRTEPSPALLPVSPVTRHLPPFALAGIFLAATQYTYKAALFVPILGAAFIGAEIFADKTFWRRNARGLAVFVIVAILVFAPLGLYFITHSGEFFERPNTVTVTGVSTLADNALKVAGMFFVRGDDNPRSNLPDRPALDPFLALGFAVGLITCMARIRRTEARFLLLWLVIMALPSVLTDFAPHFGRSIGVTPAIALIVAYGFATVLQKAKGVRREVDCLLPATYCLLPAVCCLLSAGLAFSTFSTARDYFAVWGTRTGSFDSFDAGLLTLAQELRDRPANEVVYLSPVEQEHYTVRFGLAGRDARSFDGRRVLVLAPLGVATAYGIVTREDVRSLARLKKIFPRSNTVETIYDFTGKPYAVIQRVEGAARIAPQKVVGARLGGAIELIGYDVTRESDTIALTVYWGSVAETRDDHTVFVHLVGAINPATGSPVWAQDDTRPGRGSYPTTRWQAGEVVIDEYRLALPPNLPRGEYRLEIGMYILETGARVRIVDTNGAPMESDRAILEKISLP